jgi:hypothetical protein
VRHIVHGELLLVVLTPKNETGQVFLAGLRVHSDAPEDDPHGIPVIAFGVTLLNVLNENADFEFIERLE